MFGLGWVGLSVVLVVDEKKRKVREVDPFIFVFGEGIIVIDEGEYHYHYNLMRSLIYIGGLLRQRGGFIKMLSR